MIIRTTIISNCPRISSSLITRKIARETIESIKCTLIPFSEGMVNPLPDGIEGLRSKFFMTCDGAFWLEAFLGGMSERFHSTRDSVDFLQKSLETALDNGMFNDDNNITSIMSGRDIERVIESCNKDASSENFLSDKCLDKIKALKANCIIHGDLDIPSWKSMNMCSDLLEHFEVAIAHPEIVRISKIRLGNHKSNQWSNSLKRLAQMQY